MTWLILGVLVFVCWLIGRRGVRLIVLCGVLLWVGAAAVESYQERAEAAK